MVKGRTLSARIADAGGDPARLRAGLYASLDRKHLIREADAGRIRRTTSGYDLWDRRRAVKPVRVNGRVTELAAAGWLELRPDGYWRPTAAGTAIATPST